MYQNFSNQNIRSTILSPFNSTINGQQKINLDLVYFPNIDFKEERKANNGNDQTYTEQV
jgi:hypothetical protein